MIKVVRESALLYYRLRGHYPMRQSGKRYKMDAPNAGFWHHFKRRHWEPRTLGILAEFLGPDDVYCDIGAWIGPTVFQASRLCRKVYAIEPDRVAYEHLLTNLRLNELDHVLPFNVGLCAEDGLRLVKSFGEAFGDTRTTLLAPAAADSMTIPCLSWSTFVELFDIEPPTFIKIDIEGGEFDLVPTMKRYIEKHKPIVHLSFHGAFLEDSGRDMAIRAVIDVFSGYDHARPDTGERMSVSDLASSASIVELHEVLFLP